MSFRQNLQHPKCFIIAAVSWNEMKWTQDQDKKKLDWSLHAISSTVMSRMLSVSKVCSLLKKEQ